MTSILTNSSAISALSTLRNINSDLAKTQSNVSTGYRVEKASDGAAYWSIATTMRSDNKALSSTQDAIGVGAAKTDMAYAGMQSAIDLVSEFKAKLVLATEPSADKLKINDELTQLKGQLRAVAGASSFNGENWLHFQEGDDPVAIGNPQVVGSFIRDNDGSVSIQTMELNLSDHPSSWPMASALVDDSALSHGEFGILTTDAYAYDLGLSTGYMLVMGKGVGTTYHGSPVLPQVEIGLSETTSQEQIADMTTVVDKVLDAMIDNTAKIGSFSKRISLQENLVISLQDSLKSGVGRLVDADMEEESSRLAALQTQRQLGIQALSIANNSADNLLMLFN